MVLGLPQAVVFPTLLHRDFAEGRHLPDLVIDLSIFRVPQGNRSSAKLKQCKLDARREQWLSQGLISCLLMDSFMCSWSFPLALSSPIPEVGISALCVVVASLVFGCMWGSWDTYGNLIILALG